MKQIQVLTNYFLIAILLTLTFSCGKKSTSDTGTPTPPIVTPPVEEPDGSANANLNNIAVAVDCSKQQGTLFRFEQANTTSVSSPIPGEKSRTWLKALNHKVVRVWIQLRFVKNKGYNYKYDSGAPLEDALTFYSSISDSLLVCLSAYTGTTASPMPARGTEYQNFVRDVVIYYKTKFPKIKYIQVGNEPDYSEDGKPETMEEYYPVYKDYYKGIAAANKHFGLVASKDRILISNGPFTAVNKFVDLLPYTNQFLKKYAEDTDPDKRLDFFSFHCYTENDNPQLIATDKTQIESLMTANQLPKVPIFVTELGLHGGTYNAWPTMAEAVTAQPAGQIAKMYNLYNSGIARVFNWAAYHGTIARKSELADLTNAYAYPYGNALQLCSELSSRLTRINATTTKALSSKGLGINTMASMSSTKGIAVLVWNYNYTANVANQSGNIMINNIPKSIFPNKIRRKVYLIDSKHNNIFINDSQNTLTTINDESFSYNASVGVPLTLEKNSVALVVLTPE